MESLKAHSAAEAANESASEYGGPDSESDSQKRTRGKGKGGGGGGKGKGGGGKGKAGAAVPVPAPLPKLRFPLDDLPPELKSVTSQVAEGLRVGAAVSLRHRISVAGTTLKSGGPPALTPLPSVLPCSVVLTRAGVKPLLTRALELGTARAQSTAAGVTAGDRESARVYVAATEAILAAVKGARRGGRATAREYGVAPLFSATHKPLVKVLAKHHSQCVSGEVVVTNGGAGLRLVIPVTRFLRRVEKRHADGEVPHGQLFNWSPKGSRWLRRAYKRGQNGAGLRTVRRDKVAWRCCTPGPYDPEALPQKWQPHWDGAEVVCLDPGVLLVLCSHDGRALSKDDWYRMRRAWVDFLPKPKHVRAAEASLGKDGGHAQSPGVHAFATYVHEFWRAYPTLVSHYGSRVQSAAREHKQDKLRAALDRILFALAPRPQGNGQGPPVPLPTPPPPW